MTPTDERAEAFSRLLVDSLDRSYHLALVILGERQEAEDATHDACVRAWGRKGFLRDPAKFDAWFQRILINVCRTRLRERRRAIALMPVTTPNDRISMSAERAALRDAMAALTAEHRIVIALRYLQDLTVEQIAVRTGARTGTVKSRIHYALDHLRAAYDAEDRASPDVDQ